MDKKQPDRWERIVDKEKWGNELDGFFLRPEHVVKLLHKQHRSVVRMVLHQRNDCQANANATCAQTQDMWVARAAQCQDILSKLNERVQ